jgi:hypothetical protein
MKKFLFILVLIIGGFIYLDRADVQPEEKTIVKEIEHEKLK